ncbi:MAG: 2,3-diphosphoglycerate synthetase, partial [Candidatus Methylomirabilales bacterium]
MSSIVLIDGEHYPAVTARALAKLRRGGEDPVLALLVGGREKLGQSPLELPIPVEVATEPERALAEAISRTGVEKVIDLSDEPVLGYVRRCRLASIALWKGASYTGADFSFAPPPRRLRPAAPSVGIMGTGKRTGKTSVGGSVARTYRDAGLNPVVVAMGRGGPPEPEVIEENAVITPQVLLEWAREGRHAASDYIEDALTARVPTVGAWRAGGGMAGATSFTNFDLALERAQALDPGLLVLEGSGAAIPPSHFDAGILVVNAGIDPGALCGYFGLYRLLLADLVVLTMCEEFIGSEQLEAVERCVRNRPLGQAT